MVVDNSLLQTGSQGQQQGTCPDGSQPDANGNCPSTQQQQQQQQQLTQTETGTVYVQVSGGNKTAQDFTLHIVVTSGQGSANPSDFQGLRIRYHGYILWWRSDIIWVQIKTLIIQELTDSDCPATGSQFPSSFTCHVIYTYNPSTTSSSGTPPSSTSTSTQTPSSSTTSSSQQPLTNLVPQAQRLNPGSTNSTSSPSTNSTSSPSTNSTSSPTSPPLTNLAPLSPPITQGAMTSNKTTQQPHPITSITPQSKNATNSTNYRSFNYHQRS